MRNFPSLSLQTFKESVWVDSVSPETTKSTSFCSIFYFILFYFMLFIYFYLFFLVFPLIHLNSRLIFHFPVFLLDIVVFFLQQLLNY